MFTRASVSIFAFVAYLAMCLLLLYLRNSAVTAVEQGTLAQLELVAETLVHREASVDLSSQGALENAIGNANQSELEAFVAQIASAVEDCAACVTRLDYRAA